MGAMSSSGQRGHVVVAMHHGALALLASDDAGDPSVLAQDFLDLRVLDVLHAARFEIRKPWIDPHEIRRPVEHAVGRSRDRIEDREHQLHEDVADGARAGLARLGGHQRARYARREELLVAPPTAARRRRTPTSSSARTPRAGAPGTR